MEIVELLEHTNKKLSEGYSTVKIEKELGFGKDTLRKKLNRSGYSYNKQLKQYVTQENTECYKVITQSNTISYKKEKNEYNPISKKNIGDENKMNLKEFKELSTMEQVHLINQYCDGKMNLKEIEKKYFTFTNLSKYINREQAYWDGENKKYVYIKPKQNIFTEEDYAVLQTIINNYKNKQKVNDTEFEGEVVVRSVRTYKNILDNFAKYCKNNNLKQTDALAQALKNFMN